MNPLISTNPSHKVSACPFLAAGGTDGQLKEPAAPEPAAIHHCPATSQPKPDWDWFGCRGYPACF